MIRLIKTTALAVLFFLCLTSLSPAFAESFQSEQDVQFTFEPTLTVTVSSNEISIDSLVPGSYSDSNIVTVTTSSNAISGYSLSSTVGNNTHNYNTLKHASSNDTFANLTSNKASLSAFSDNTWGYSYSTDSGSTWISGDVGSTATGYNGLPLCNQSDVTECSGTQLVDTNTNGSTAIQFKIGAKASSSQPAGAYSNVINFVGVAKPNPVPPPGLSTLYDYVADMSKGKNTAASSGFSWTSITQPTSTDPTTDTSTSGVFEWDGTDSNGGSEKVYFYRGILDTTLATYGSDGLADAYPNYVKLSNGTCWRIVRTTSTGGVKMVYNGTWGDTTADSCANTQTKAQTRYNGADLTVPFNTSSSSKAGKTYTGLQQRNIHAVGYTYTSSVPASTTSTKTPAELFGASGNDTTTNNQSSIMKQYVEDWYAGTMTSYTDKLEGDAGFCQDRRLNTSTTWTTPLAEDSNTIIPYGTSGMTEYSFGAYPRNTQASTFNPLLTCPRGKVDLYSYTSNAGNGNGQLTYPVALLTADEASLAGDGWDNSFSANNANSYLRSGSYFWLLSPYRRYSGGNAGGFGLDPYGYLCDNFVNYTYGVRPAISFASGTVVASGSGTATDPWIVNP